MLLNSLILFLAAMLGGFLAYRFRSMEKISFDLPLIFAGAYLFGVTIVHVIPELFASTSNPMLAGVFVLAGFYLQQMLEYLTSGVEHGHLHKPHHDHKHSSGMAISLLVGLSIHSLLEGSLLGHPHEIASGKTWPLLIGIVLHKAPAAFAMMTLLVCHYKKSSTSWIFLLIFALASPVGLVLSETAELTPMYSEVLFALVSGSFLHISTTIVFESSPQHKFKISRILISILGALLAILVQVLA